MCLRGQGVILAIGQLNLLLFKNLYNSAGEAPGADQIRFGLFDGIAGLDQIFFSFQDLMLHAIHFGAKIRGDRVALGGTFGIYQHKQKDDGPQPAGNDIQKG